MPTKHKRRITVRMRQKSLESFHRFIAYTVVQGLKTRCAPQNWEEQAIIADFETAAERLNKHVRAMLD